MLRAFIALIFIALTVTPTFAKRRPRPQQVTITVTDPQGAVVSKAVITLHSPETQCSETIVTGDNGRASTAARPGHYELLVTSPGFADAKQTSEVRAEVNTIPVTLHVAGYSGPEVTPADVPTPLHLRMLVVDATGKSVAGAWIRLRAQGYFARLRTDQDGRASIDGPPERYDLSVTARGYKSYERQGYLPAEREFKITLDPGDCANVFPNSARKTQ